MSERERREPTFLLLGAPKCGTTSLAYYLSQHPDVHFSDPKEPVFFEAEYEEGLDHYWRKYFAGWRGQPAIGEGRVWHLYLPFVPERIRASLPDARLVAVLRDPVDRAFSHWWHRFSRGQESLDFETAIARDRARIEAGEGFRGEEGARRWREGLYGLHSATRHRALLDLGFYDEQLERYLALYPASQLQVLLYDDLARAQDDVMRDVFRFVGVDPEAPIEDTSEQNVRRETQRSASARRALFAIRALRLQHLVPKRLRPLVHRAAERPAKRPRLRPEVRASLVEYFEPHTARLEAMLERDLSAWRRS